MYDKTYVLIMAGGLGSRFWPASRESLPKQFLDITGSGQPLLRQTFERFARFVPRDHIYVIAHADYATQVKACIPELTEAHVLLEPSRNNTGPSIAYASMKLAARHPGGTCIVAPADHLIADEGAFHAAIRTAVDHAGAQGSIVTLGIEPTRPDTGYGYIEFREKEEGHVKKVLAFREKPDLATAKAFLAAGGFVWNAGIFVWRWDTILEAFARYAPQIYDILNAGADAWDTPHEDRFLAEAYPRTDRISVDYAILEKADNVFTVPCDIGWSDLGTWASLYELLPKDEAGNVAIGGPAHLVATDASLVSAPSSKLVVVKGLSDYIVVDTPDCLLIFPKQEEQAIKQLRELLRDKGYNQYL
jgi:mannose-1-phosphate guanylyltransferase